MIEDLTRQLEEAAQQERFQESARMFAWLIDNNYASEESVKDIRASQLPSLMDCVVKAIADAVEAYAAGDEQGEQGS
jgi:hypothetical protein